MKIPSFSLLFLGVVPLFSQQLPPPKSHIDDLMAGAKARTAQQPPRADAYDDLANALVRRAREKSDPAYLRQAEDAIQQALRVAPGDFEARKVRVIVRLEQGRYADALEESTALNNQIPDDNVMYGLVCDAQLALGNYKEAEAAAQRMIDLRQVSAPGLEHGAKIREAIGYVDGAIDWWNSALRLTSANDQEQRAYIMLQIARLNRESGKPDVAARFAQESLALVPGYPRGLTELAADRLAEGKPAEAVALLRRRLAASRDLASLYWLGVALDSAGSKPESLAVFADFEKQAIAASGEPGNVNTTLIVYEAEHGNPALALRIAKRSASARHDSETLDAYAWALYYSGDYAEAQKQEARALAPGIRNASMYFHAGMIARKEDDGAEAAKFLRKSLEVNAGSADAPRVIQELAAAAKAPPSD